MDKKEENKMDIQDYLLQARHDFANSCTCNVCHQIRNTWKAKIRNEKVSALVDAHFLKYPKLPENIEEWSLGEKQETLNLSRKIRSLYDDTPIVEKLSFNKRGEMIKKLI